MNAITLKAGAVLFISTALVPLPSPPRSRVVQIDPQRCNFRVSAPLGRKVPLSKDGVLITANYYAYKKPVGVMVDNGKEVPWLQIKKPRAALVINKGHANIKVYTPAQVKANLRKGAWKDAVVVQSGPLLVDNGLVVAGRQKQIEQFDSGVFRRTNHVAVGITRTGKLLFLFSSGRTLEEVAYLIKSLGAVQAIHCDGGHSASMIYKGNVYGIGNPRTVLVAEPGNK